MPRLMNTILALLFAVQGSSLAQAQLQVQPQLAHPEITAGGRGQVSLAPDYAYLQIGVVTQTPNAAQTASQNAAKVANIISALRALGLTDQQVTTTGYNLEQIYEYPKNQEPRVRGYTARNTIRAEVRRLDDLGRVIDAAIGAGATNVSSIQYLASNTDQARRTALSDAVKQARSDADVMARAAGGTLGRLLSMNTGPISQPIALRGASFEAAGMLTSSGGQAVPTPITPGELNVIANVYTRWEFVPSGSR